ncbi:FTS and Hook-interacting protein-like isoform X2 [Patiria miniata]|uniref:FHF complex subunit HOOK-interacting protein C-terminal domain-containing protein n=1 Tax=Patiria miniata TaxID=46514 RepID=A0A913ZUD7_PATMI|nr:FTS and Hook-interacting protein-like isoform X2 [Patiria miniata]
MSRLIRRLSNASITSITSIGTPASHTNGLPGVAGSVGPMDVPADADPQACFEVFCSHWAQIKGIIVKQNASGSNRFPRSKATFDDIQAVANYATQMMYLLVEETQPAEGTMGPMLELTIGEKVMDRLLSWGLACGEHVEDMTREMLRIYEMMLSQAKQAVLMHNELLNPLLRLLLQLSGYCSDRLELHLVLLLHQLCVSLSKDPMLLEYLFHASPSQGPAKFLLFSLLIPFLHRDGKVGQQARDALLLCIAVSSQGDNIAKYITESTNLCPVLATGLGALYSRLPRKLDIKVDHWHCLTREDWTVMPELCMFLHSLEFCNAVVQVAHPLVSAQLVQYFHDGFLVPVIGPALHQAPQDEIVATTAYVNLFVSSITSSRLMRAFLHYLCMGQHEGRLVLDSLLARIGSNSRLCLVTLSLFHTLVNLNCEDFMLELILKFLVPCNHIMVSQRKAIKEVDLHSKSADRFLSLRPACCKSPSKDAVKSAQSMDSHSANATTSSVMDSARTGNQVMLGMPNAGHVHPNARTPSQNFLSRGKDVRAGQGAIQKHQPPQPSPVPPKLPPMILDLSDFETSQVEYLLDAKEGIQACTLGTHHWSAPYDGLNPPPATLSPDSLSPAEDKARISSSFDITTNAPNSASFPILATEEDLNAGSSSYKGHAVAELLPRNRERLRSLDVKLTATIQEVLSLKIGSDSEKVDTSDVNITDLFMDENAAVAVQTPRVEASTLQVEQRSSSETITEVKPIENGFIEDSETHDEVKISPVKLDQSENASELPLPESKGSTGKSRPKDLNLTGPATKPSQESDSAFSGSNSPVLDSNLYNGTSSGGVPNGNIGSSQKGSQVANWLQALGEDASGASFIENLSNEKKKEKRLSSAGQPESEKDQDEPCVFWEFDSDIEFSPKGGRPRQDLAGGEGSANEAKQILDALGFNSSKGEPMSTNQQSNSRSKAHRTHLDSETSEAGTDEPLSSSLNENHFSMLNSSVSSDVKRQNQSFTSQGASHTGWSPTQMPQYKQSLRPQEAAARPLYSPIGRAIGMPTTGPFMEAIFSRLDTMMENSFYVNLLLTGIIARLAYYPQPLLRSYLLNTTMVFQPSVRSLIQILTTIRNRLDPYAKSIPEFGDLLVRAKDYLFMREDDGDSTLRGRSLSEIVEPGKFGRTRSGSLKTLAKHKSAFDNLLRRGKARNKSLSATEKQKLAKINEGGMALPAASAEYQSLKTRNAVYCAVIFDEFLKELAAISQEHAVAFSEQELGLR